MRKNRIMKQTDCDRWCGENFRALTEDSVRKMREKFSFVRVIQGFLSFFSSDCGSSSRRGGSINFSKEFSSVATLSMAKKQGERVMKKATFKMAARIKQKESGKFLELSKKFLLISQSRLAL